ncbi:MAG: fumarylacetoacetate hydrolase family protein [Bacteroidales bacterium]|nr:fumarylacetoacetate hydrolase family protein [Bacteroidales bacterium]
MKIFCLAANYRKHGEEINLSPEKNPVFFLKPETSLLRNHYDFYIPEFSNQVEYETEVVIKIGKMGKAIEPRFASRYYDEITVGLDITARDLQNEYRAKGLPWFLSKGFDLSAPLGDFVNKREFQSIYNLDFGLRINGEVAQMGNTADMIFNFDQIVSYISQFVTLKVGDLIYTGTPAGVGPLRIGDKLEAELAGRKLLEIRVK